jgi:hypothetical protein
MRVDMLGEAWIAPRPVREVRLLLRHRAALVKMRTTLKTRVRAVLADRGIDGIEALWDGPGRRWLEKLELPDVERESSTICAACRRTGPMSSGSRVGQSRRSGTVLFGGIARSWSRLTLRSGESGSFLPRRPQSRDRYTDA